MSTDDNAGPDDSESPGDGFAELRAQLRNLPRRTAPPSFESELDRRLTSPTGSPLGRVLRMRPFLALVTTFGGLLIILSFLIFPGTVDSHRSATGTPGTDFSPGGRAEKIQAEADTAGGDSLSAVKRVSTANP